MNQTATSGASIPSGPITQKDSKLPTRFLGSEDNILSDQQLRAIDAILVGNNQTEAANLAGVTRKTLYLWRHQDENFRQELRRRQEAMWNSSIDRLRALIPSAVAMLQSDLKGICRHNRSRAAAAVLRLANLRSVVPVNKPEK